MKIGFIGTGVMGSRMVQKLLAAGFEVSVYNRSPEKLTELIKQGAIKAKTVKEIVQQSDVICSCLSMPKDSIDVYLGDEGVIKYAEPGKILIDFATIGADTSKVIHNEAAKKGIHYLDAPVSGGPEGVEQGSLTIMVGGDKGSFEQTLPILESFGKTIQYLGPAGSGSIAKLINQYLVAVHSVAASEAMVAGASFGLDSEQLYQLLSVSYGASRMLERHMEQYVLDRNFEPGGAVKYVHKDVVLANQLFIQAGMTDVLGQFAERSFQTAIGKGLADLDMSAVIQPLEESYSVTVKKS